MQEVADLFERARAEIGKVVLGNHEAVHLSLIALLSEGHVLLEGPPGTAKTLLARCLARCLDIDFKRIQFTPDLMPSDVVGTNVLEIETGRFHFRRGPVFTDLLLADEINRAPAKTQAALLQAMQEHEVTIDGETYPLGEVFLVVATQNPVEMEGTYPLPEAQLDRFLFQVLVDYPELGEEVQVLERHHATLRDADLDRFELAKVADAAQLKACRAAARRVEVRQEVAEYVTRLARETRSHPSVQLGVSSRGALMTLIASKVEAAAQGREFVTPDDVKRVAVPAMRHRLLLQPGALVEGVRADEVIDEILSQTEVPR